MRKAKFQLVKTTCRRCGCSLYTGSRSLFGADELKRQYDRICAACMPVDEQAVMMNHQGKAIIHHLAGKAST